MTHDGGCISVGVTTVFDSLSLGSFGGQESRSSDNLYRLADGLGKAAAAGALKADHRLHWRCELPSEFVGEEAERLAPHPLTGLFSLMDHTPGQRQYMHKERFLDRAWRAGGMSEEAIAQRMEAQLERQARNVEPNRALIAAIAKARGVPLAAHDDETDQHVDDAADVGATIAEFPVTAAAAKRSRERGMAVIMGGPNLIRGGSYSGNLGAAEAADLGVLDGFASDYVPRSLIECAFALTAPRFGWTLPAAFAAVSRVPAVAAGLADRGVIAPDKRADLVRIRMVGGLPMVCGVWAGGARVG
jgi:alpha-D-ribose 1-methylphosphonate 5-triphosphate diphosphatase